ncbi:DNA repair exonuclease [Rhizobium sp. EC-SD404]|uniref:metallophosphoesterase family protein n=1 Tax=Rhizobium sp. EC-SD404 TaxID=2038389 RepID=UPI00125A21DD|nr:DNA repair exonuclease [Rhizobium sp. EC-SD404]VVT08641.1 DNA repair exonuclease family protein YhaO [Rhizobium sp. EC-SD404]
MSRFRFIHAADLHLGSPFEGLAIKDRVIAERFAAATRDAFSELVRRAIEEEVAFFIVAGDVYDGEWRDNSIGLFFNREVARLDRAAIPVFLLKGNHDADSVVTKSITLPTSVSQFDTRKPSSFALDDLKVSLHGQGFAERAASDNLARAYPAPVPGHFNIGVLHTSLTGRPPHANYAPCSVDDLRARGYDYWALGHVHDHEIVANDPPIVFPGNLQGRNIRESGEKGAVLVSVEDGRVASIDRLVVDQARWQLVSVDVSAAETVPALLRLVEDALGSSCGDGNGRLTALRVALIGASALRPQILMGRAELVDEIQAACHRIDPDIWLEKLDLRVGPIERPLAVDEGDARVDLQPLLADLVHDPALVDAAEAALREILAKLPAASGSGDAPLGATVDDLLAEARDVLLARSGSD